jgi:serine/threonine-protein kinase
LLARFGTSDSPQIAERTARACLLLPASEEEMTEAVALADLAARADAKKFASTYPSFQFVKGLAEYRQGHFDRAIAIMRGDASKMPGPPPRLVLSMALHRSGKEAEARKIFASAMLNHNWHEYRVTGEDGWIRHVLRREAERMIVPNLTAMLEGKQLPRDNDERVAQIGACGFANRQAALARIYADAFAASPKRTTIHLQNAARVAVQAGCGRGIDAGSLGEAERRNWRAQARTWLREALSAMIRATDRDFNKVHGDVHKALKGWPNEPELAGIRDSSELEKLLPDEQADCRKLWAEVNAVLDSTSKPR